ncbi:hypothetical protein Psuf_082680 [Phytohabitans suffuscus]|uniref:Uncharacterized protein n=1 Tax=Phytohabitans suffuscus TaxID=624315 RepID=A0A6F8YXQ6_9ACTN|nr:hypothetical protein Psuf_082680 [Phytohabitans suffuscus]
MPGAPATPKIVHFGTLCVPAGEGKTPGAWDRVGGARPWPGPATVQQVPSMPFSAAFSALSTLRP